MDELDKETIDDLVKRWGNLIPKPEPISEPTHNKRREVKNESVSSSVHNDYDDDFLPFDDYVPPKSYYKKQDYSLYDEPKKPEQKPTVDPLKEKFNKEADDLISSLLNEIGEISKCSQIAIKTIQENQIDPLKIAQVQIAKKQLNEIAEMSWRQVFNKR